MRQSNSSNNKPSIWREGIIDSKDYEEQIKLGKARVRLPDRDNILTKPLRVLTAFAAVDKLYLMPKIDDAVIVLTDENCEDGVILGATYNTVDKPPADTHNKHRIEFEDEAFIEYDKEEHKLTINLPEDESELNIALIATDSKINVSAEGEININVKGITTVQSEDDIVVQTTKGIDVSAVEAINISSDVAVNITPPPC